MSKWIKNKDTGLVYRPINKKVYPLIAIANKKEYPLLANIGSISPAVFKVDKLGYTKFLVNHLLNNDKSLYEKWKKINVLSGDTIFDWIDDDSFTSLPPFCEVILKTVPSYLKDSVFNIWVEKDVEDFVKPNTREIFKGII